MKLSFGNFLLLPWSLASASGLIRGSVSHRRTQRNCTPAPPKLCYFSCADALATTCNSDSGLYDICPLDVNSISTVYCDQESSGGGWMLLYSYAHEAGNNDPLDGSVIPLDPHSGYSHFSVSEIAGYDETDIESVRFYCTTTGHNRVMHFETLHPYAASLAFDGTADSPPSVSVWNNDTCFVNELEGHSAFLPLGASNAWPTVGFAEGFPFYKSNRYHWAIGATHTGGARWECDDFLGNAPSAGYSLTSTLHNVWVKMANAPATTTSPVPSTSALPSSGICPLVCVPSPPKPCYFSCADALATTCNKASGLYDICPSDPSSISTVYCDQETIGGGWMLLYSYAHEAGNNDPLDGSVIPLDPVSGYSHFSVSQIGGYDETDIESVRFYCITTGHNRAMHFLNTHPYAASLAFDGVANGPPSVSIWNNDTGTIEELEGHSAFLPLGASNAWPTVGFAEGFPFYTSNKYHWAIGASHTGGARWECDDFLGNSVSNGYSSTSTLHNVWVRMAVGTSV